MTHEEITARFSKWFEQYVPDMGKADTVGGEIVRAYNRIAYRNWNDGDHVGVGYGKETCNPAARYIAAKCGDWISDYIFTQLWGEYNDDRYDTALDVLGGFVIDYLEANEDLFTKENTEDMFDYTDENEDRDDSWDEDEDEEEDCEGWY